VIGFNIAIVSFQIVQLYRLSGGIRVPGIDHVVHVGADMALFMALALSLMALVAYIASGTFDEVGYCTHWSLVAGDLLMYLALAHTVAGFFAPLASSMKMFSAKLPDQAAEIAILHGAALVAGGLGWFLATYVGPITSLVRSPFNRRTNTVLAAAYLALLLALSWVSAHAARLEVSGLGDQPGLLWGVIRELFQPLRW
jgi:hypothetical protein